LTDVPVLFYRQFMGGQDGGLPFRVKLWDEKDSFIEEEVTPQPETPMKKR
jgi:hypothetical protein